MANINKIALRIYGGAIGDSLSKQPIVSVGDVPHEFHPTAPTLVDEQQVWIITHAQDYTLYATSSKRCHTSDDQPGQILICLFLPPQKRLADGHGPLEVLEELMDIFAVQGIRGGKLSGATVNCSPFNSLLDKYRLEDRPMLLPIMAGQAPATFCVESKAQLDAMMRHSRYSILSSVGRLELGFNCKSTIALIRKGPAKRSETPSRKDETPESVRHESPKTRVVSGGLPLGDEPVVANHPSLVKKLLKIVAILVGTFLGLFVLLCVIGIFVEDDETQNAEIVSDKEKTEPVLSNKCEEVVDSMAVVESDTPIIAIDHQQMAEVEAKAKALAEIKKARAEAKAKAKEAEAKKAEAKKRMEEKARKAEEKKKKSEDTSWQSSIRQYAQSCPIQLRLGVRITSITYTSNSVTYTVNYEELSKYDLDSEDRDKLATDRSSIIKKYGVGLPSGIHTSIIQKDKAGRTF